MNRHASSAIALGIALALVATPRAEAQRDTTRRAVSEQRIPVSKDQAVVRESRGEVALAPELARIATLEGTVASLEQRLAMAEASAANMALRTSELERQVTMLRDSLGIVNAELANARAEFAARAAALSDSMQLLNGRFARLRNGSLFGHSGFYIGLGSGVNLTTGALHDIGYSQGPNFLVPIGWSKPGVPLGIRTEWGVQSFEGAVVPGFQNIDPVLYTATAVATLNMPMNNAKTNTFYLMGGGGAFLFHRFGTTSALNDRFGNETKDVLKWGLTGGAGLEFHILGASSLFVQSSFTNVFAEKSKLNLANDNKNLRWVPLTAGIVLR